MLLLSLNVGLFRCSIYDEINICLAIVLISSIPENVDVIGVVDAHEI